ncbi:hypothetical protein, partial [Corynebacterium diphtheriae]|uniref:hypothetical protein n=1 Tax=Corynebacterium diphtheriae TaxID=1717 RepID=UPI00197CEAB4
MNATTITKKAITRHFARKDSPTDTPINGKDRRHKPTFTHPQCWSAGWGVHQLESKNTNPRIRKPKVGISAKKSRPAVFVFLSSRRREKGRAGKGAGQRA